jgi:hypothetical protein
MTLDTFNAGGDGFEWTSDHDANGNAKAGNIDEYFKALTDNNYLSKNDLKKLVTAPGKGPGLADATGANSCFSFFQVSEASPSDQAFVITKNWKEKALVPGTTPYGIKGFVVFTKGGSGGIFRRVADASSATLFPTATTTGETYTTTTLN